MTNIWFKKVESSPVSPAPTRLPRHLPSGEKVIKHCPEMRRGAFYMCCMACHQFFLVSFRFRPNCVNQVSLTTHSHTPCPPALPLPNHHQPIWYWKAQSSNRVHFWGWYCPAAKLGKDVLSEGRMRVSCAGAECFGSRSPSFWGQTTNKSKECHLLKVC